MSGSKFTDSSKNRVCLLLLLNVIYLAIFIRFFPNAVGGLGHDYAYWFPRLLAGDHWFEQNGFLSVPWFTPALNGGNLLYADPESIYFSFPQLIAIIADPLTSITITFAVFSTVGLLGFYRLLRKVFHRDFWSSFLGAGLFVFNGFYTYRMIVGHLPYHGYMLFPWILIGLLWRKNNRRSFYRDILGGAIAAFMLSYCFYAGGIHFLIPATMSVFAVCLIYVFTCANRDNNYILVRICFFLFITVTFCGSKLVAGLSVLKNLPRAAYKLPGIPDVADAIRVPLQSVFFNSITGQEANHILANMQWALDQHEFEYGITFLPLVLIVLGCGRRILRFSREKIFVSKGIKQWLYAMLIGLILLLPVLANYYTPQWNAFLKTLPVIRSSSNLVRWYAVYIPVGIIFSVLALDTFKFKPRVKRILVVVSLAIVIAVNLLHDKTFCYLNSYDYHPLLQGLITVKEQGEIPPINYVGITARAQTPQKTKTYGNDALINVGVSPLQSRFSLFGYQLEFFPQKDKLKIGRADRVTNNTFNMKNPSCYIFPKENGCLPGDHFRVDQREQLHNFRHYRAIQFHMPPMQRVANWVSVMAFLTFGIFLLGHLIYRITAYRYDQDRVAPWARPVDPSV